MYMVLQIMYQIYLILFVLTAYNKNCNYALVMGVNSCTVDKVCMVFMRHQFNNNFLTIQQKIIRNLVQILTCSCIGLRYSNSLRLLIIIRGVVKKNRIINRIRLTMIAVIHHFHLDLDRFSLKGNKFSQNYDLKLLQSSNY